MVLLREREVRRCIGAIEPCLPSPAKEPPPGPGWIHEIKHDGFRLIARRDGDRVRLITRAGNEFSWRFPLIAAAMEKLPVRSCVIDGEAIVCDDSGLAVFDLIRRHGTHASAVHCAFDMLELDGEDMRRLPIEERKARRQSSYAAGRRPSCSMSITTATARSFTSMPASSAARASCLSGSDRFIAPADRRIG